MRNLLNLLYRFRNLILFLVLEGLAVSLVVKMNSPQAGKFAAWMLVAGAGLNDLDTRITGYFNLAETNEVLSADLRELRIQVDSLRSLAAYLRNTLPQSGGFYAYSDSARTFRRFKYIPCRAVENTLSGNFNYLVINVGRQHGLRPEMGLVTATGVAGIVTEVSDNYSLAMSLLNRNLKLSIRVKGKDILGTFAWKGGSTRFGSIEYVPLHYQPRIGDTVVTSNLSSIFPEGLVVGVVSEITESKNNGFYDITVKLATDFNTLDYLYAIEAVDRPETDSLTAKAVR